MEENKKPLLSSSSPLALRDEIITFMKDLGIYEPKLVFQVDLLAHDIVMYRRLHALAQKSDPVTGETLRSGDVRMVLNPLFTELRQWGKKVEADFAALHLNLLKRKDVVEAESADPLGEFMSKFNED